MISRKPKLSTGGAGRPFRTLRAFAAGGLSLALFAACGADVGTQSPGESANAGGPSVPYGAPIEEWHAAFDEIDEEFELIWQMASPPTSDQGETTQAVVEQIEEYSNGKISIELVYNDAVSGSATESDEALQDGRIDLHMLATQLQPSDFPVSGRVQNESTAIRGAGYITGGLGAFGALNEVWWEQPELHEEVNDLGLTLLTPLAAQPYNVMACREPVVSLDDIEGKQVRVGPAAAFDQIEALGASPVSIPFAELFESLQRGIVDCMLVSPDVLAEFEGMTELVPHIAHPVGTSFVSTTAIDVAGIDWPNWPLAVQQLIYDAHADYLLEYLSKMPKYGLRVHEEATAAGGGINRFDEDVNQVLAEHNERMIQSWEETDLLTDGNSFGERVTSSSEEWQVRVTAAGFPDAELFEVEQWSEADIDWSAWDDLYLEYVHLPNRPE